ncbi:MAG: hypothetical protein EXQ53_11835 [Acidobacteria bacterium]|nr:hypothetical protein [Acidobacteriota bacterium]
MYISRRIALLAIAAVALSARVAIAHDGHDHLIMGTVTARDATHLEVKTPSGEVLSIAVTDKTMTTRDKKKIAFTDVQVGRRVVVNIGNGEDPLIAREIQLGVAPVTAAPAKSH